jgi:hypothetical protein
MEDLSLHILDIVENSLRSEAKLVQISLLEDPERDLLTVQIKDDGRGMEPETLRQASDPFFTSKQGRKVGLGLALLAQAAQQAEGTFHISSSPGSGTTVTASFSQSHPDCKPLGDICATMELLVSSHPGVQFVFEHKSGTGHLRLDTRHGPRPTTSRAGTDKRD